MELALREAEVAFEKSEVPVGAVVVFEGRIIGRGHNLVESMHDATAHAEMVALSAAYNHFDDWRLEECDLVCTLEPCSMCIGAAILSRIRRVVFGARDPKFGACGSVLDIPSNKKLNHEIEIIGGVREAEAAHLMKSFFEQVRNSKREVN
jgi:tRNA(adenine34) deaminase